MTKVGFELTVRDLSVTYSDKNSSKRVFENIGFSVKPGEVVALCGLSGVGKSTLVRTIAGLVKPSQGEVIIDSQIITEPISEMGFVTQDYSRTLFPWLTVEKNITLPFKRTDISKSERSSRAKDAMEEVGISAVANSYPWQLSGGMQQRVAIARALVMKPKLLILDEPFASVDVYVRLELEDLVSSLVHNHGTTTLIVTHDIDEAIYMADRVLVLSGAPANVSLELAVDLARPRAQMPTRSDSHFLKLRDTLYASIRS
jgi:NitT/TauT family transport system ATP-binding protein